MRASITWPQPLRHLCSAEECRQQHARHVWVAIGCWCIEVANHAPIHSLVTHVEANPTPAAGTLYHIFCKFGCDVCILAEVGGRLVPLHHRPARIHTLPRKCTLVTHSVVVWQTNAIEYAVDMYAAVDKLYHSFWILLVCIELPCHCILPCPCSQKNDSTGKAAATKIYMQPR